jgi:uncharacterized membrane protein HdeD (DUF308 family)
MRSAGTVPWVIALFFGCTLAFAGVHRLTQDQPAGVVLAAQFGALALIVAALVLFVRRRGDGDGG